MAGPGEGEEPIGDHLLMMLVVVLLSGTAAYAARAVSKNDSAIAVVLVAAPLFYLSLLYGCVTVAYFLVPGKAIWLIWSLLPNYVRHGWLFTILWALMLIRRRQLRV